MHARPRFLLALLLVASAIAVGFPQLRAQEAQAIPGPRGTHTENGLAGFAKILCSGVFVSGRTPEDVARGSAYFFMPRAERDQVKWTIDRDAKLARASFASARAKRVLRRSGLHHPESRRSPGSTSRRWR